MKLLEKLGAFKNAERTEKTLPYLFKEIAEYFLCEGYFCVNGKRKVYICDVEFYYHEEEGEIKDWIMYHRNNHPNNKNVKELGYLELGQLNSHVSGMDITFENEDEKYRAAMLIRGFKIVPTTPEPKPALFDYSYSGKYDDRSTHLYDALLNCGNIKDGLTIEWIPESRQCELAKPTFRHNVADNKELDQKCKGSKYKQCMRMWRFHIE